MRDLRAAGHGLAVFADDGEKFGGWPGTREWVYDKGWLRDFLNMMESLVDVGRDHDEHLHRCAPCGAVGWTRVSADGVVSGNGGLVAAPRLPRRTRGSSRPSWVLIGSPGRTARSFVARIGETSSSSIPESNRAHKKMMALSALCRRRGDPEDCAARDRTRSMQRRVLAWRVRRTVSAAPA